MPAMKWNYSTLPNTQIEFNKDSNQINGLVYDLPLFKRGLSYKLKPSTMTGTFNKWTADGFETKAADTYACEYTLLPLLTAPPYTVCYWLTPLSKDVSSGESDIVHYILGCANVQALSFDGYSDSIALRLQTPSYSWCSNSIGYSFFVLNKMHHLVYIIDHDGTNWSIKSYLNGVYFSTSNPTTDTVSSNIDSYIKMSSSGIARTDNAILHDVRLYNRKLSTSEIATLYQPSTRWELYNPVIPKRYFAISTSIDESITLSKSIGFSVEGVNTTLYVDYKNGLDTNDGSSEAPLKTLAHTLSAHATNGDIIKLRGSTADKTTWYRERPSTSLTTLTIQADTGHTPVLVGSTEFTSWAKTDGRTNVYETAYTTDAVYGCWNGTTRLTSVADVATCDSTTNSYYFDDAGNKLYVNIGGGAPTSIEACATNAYALQLTGAGATISNLIFQYQCQAIRFTGGTSTANYITCRYWFPASGGRAFGNIYLDTGSTYTISNCTLSLINQDNLSPCIGSDSDVSSITISGCVISSARYGIVINGGTGHFIHDCTITDVGANDGWGLLADGNSTGTIYNITVYDSDYGGIKVGSLNTETANDWTIHHCTVYGNSAFYGFNSDGGNSNWYHCIAYDLNTDGFIMQTDGVVVAKNCIAMNCDDYGFFANPTYTPTLTADYNCAYGNGIDNYNGDWTQGANDIISNPAFTNAPTDFTLQAGSPCIDEGVVVSGINNGYHGLAPDIGRYESMATFYVDYKDGVDTNDGSSGSPLKTLGHTVASHALSGDTIKLRGADAQDEWYREYTQTIGAISLTTLTIQADTGHTPVLVSTQRYTSWTKTGGYTNVYQATHRLASSAAKAWGVWNNGITKLTSVESIATCDATTNSYYFDSTNYIVYVNIGGSAPTAVEIYDTWNDEVLLLTGSGITLDGITFRFGMEAVEFTGGSGTIQNCTFEKWVNYAMGGDFAGLHLNGASGYTIDNCTFNLDVTLGTAIYGATTSGGIAISNSTISNCRDAIGIYGGTGHTIEDSTFYNLERDGVHIESGTVTIRRCDAHDYDHAGFLAKGAQIYVYHCLAYISAAGSGLWLAENGYVAEVNGSADFYHCVAANFSRSPNHPSQERGFYSVSHTTSPVVNVKNCIAYNCNEGFNRDGTDTGTKDYNCAYGNDVNYVASWSQGANDIITNPSFVDQANDDYHLASGSPCINEGVVISGVNDNYYGTAPDIGRYEYIEESITSLEKFIGVSVAENISGGGIEESVELGKILRVTERQPLNINEDVTLSVLYNIGVNDQVIVGDLVSLSKQVGLETNALINIIDFITLIKNKGFSSTSQSIENDLTSLGRINTLAQLDQTNESDLVNLGYFNTIISIDQTVENDATILADFIGISVIEETQGFINETVILVRSLAIEVLQEGISNVNEDVTISRSAWITAITECQVNDDLILNRSSEINEILERYVNDSTILDRLNGISETVQYEINDNAILDRLNDISEALERYVNDAAILDRLIGIDEIAECQVNNDLILNRLSGISETEQCQVNDDLILNRLSDISEVEQCLVNNAVILEKFVRIIIIDETIGQYAENVIFNRFASLTAFEEGISHVSESVSIDRLNIITINEQSKLYNSLIFGRLNGLSILPEYRLLNSLILSKSDGLNVNAQSIANENITASKFDGLNTNSQIVVPESISLSQLYNLAILDSRYLLESISLQYANGLSVIDSPIIFEEIELGRIDIVTLITVLFGYNNINLDQYKYIIAEPPSLYVYNDGNHSIGVLFRDKRLEVPFRDKRATTYWRDKREK